MAQNDARIGKRYAQALFSLAEQYKVVDAVEGDLNALAELMAKDRAFRDFLIAPYASREEKTALLERVFSDRMTALTMQALRVMLEKRREAEIESVRGEFVALRREAMKVVYANVVSAEPLDDRQRKAILDKLEHATSQTIEADFAVEPALVGGVKVAFANYVLDGSLKGALARLRGRLKHDILKQG